MNLPLSHFTLHAPDEITSYWFVSADFAGLLGKEFSRDAAKEFKRVAGSGVRIDYEADAVTIRISRANNVLPALRAIYGLAGWDAAELDAIAPQVESFKRPKSRKVAIGDVFIIPVAPNKFALGQVLRLIAKAPTVAVFAGLAPANELKAEHVAAAKLLTILHIHGNAIYKGEWPIVGNMPVRHDPNAGPGKDPMTVGGTSYGGDGPIVDLLQMHAGLQPWKGGYGDANFYRKLVMP